MESEIIVLGLNQLEYQDNKLKCIFFIYIILNLENKYINGYSIYE